MTKRRPMTEEEWLTSDSPYLLLQYLQQHRLVTKVPGGRRFLRLFNCACCRSVWDLLDEPNRCAVEVSELYADGGARRSQLAAVEQEAEGASQAAHQSVSELARQRATDPAVLNDAKLHQSVTDAARWTAGTRFGVHAIHLVAMSVQLARMASTPQGMASPEAGERRHQEERFQSALIRDVFGNPWRPVTLDADWLSWNEGVLTRLAKGIYQERTFDQLPILADALEEAGCNDLDILTHCREPATHVRGCWVLDTVLGKR